MRPHFGGLPSGGPFATGNCGNLDILFVYPSHLGPWATFGGLVRLVVGRVQDKFFFRILVILCLLGSNYQFYAISPKFNQTQVPGPVWAFCFWWALAAMKIFRDREYSI